MNKLEIKEIPIPKVSKPSSDDIINENEEGDHIVNNSKVSDDLIINENTLLDTHLVDEPANYLNSMFSICFKVFLKDPNLHSVGPTIMNNQKFISLDFENIFFILDSDPDKRLIDFSKTQLFETLYKISEKSNVLEYYFSKHHIEGNNILKY